MSDMASVKFDIDASIEQYMFSVDGACDADLEANLVANGGARDKLIIGDFADTGRKLLVDGHRRYRICERLKLPYEVDVVKFADMKSAREFMDHLQLSRRNLPSNQMAVVRGRLANRRCEDMPVRKAAAAVAAETGVSERQIYRDMKYAEAVDSVSPGLRDEAMALPRRDAEEVAVMEPDEQATAVQQRKLKAKPVKDAKKLTRGAAFDRAGKLVAMLQNALADVNAAKPDKTRLRMCKEKAKDIGNLLDIWGSDHA